jgi:hypothetical protein
MVWSPGGALVKPKIVHSSMNNDRIVTIFMVGFTNYDAQHVIRFLDLIDFSVLKNVINDV